MAGRRTKNPAGTPLRRPGRDWRKETSGGWRLHLDTEAYHGDKIMQQRAILRAGRWSNNFLGECRDVVTEFRAQEDSFGEGELDARNSVRRKTLLVRANLTPPPTLPM